MIIPLKSRFLQLSEEEFFLFCQEMRDFQIEREADQTILIMSPTGSESGYLNNEISFIVTKWNKEQELGLVFDSSSGFTLPNGAVRSPDVSWISKERWNAISLKDRKRFAPIAPDFVIEIRSETDSIEMLKNKMLEYQSQGVRLAWLIDPVQEEVWIYRVNGTISQVDSLDIPLLGENVLEGFTLQISKFWPLED